MPVGLCERAAHRGLGRRLTTERGDDLRFGRIDGRADGCLDAQTAFLVLRPRRGEYLGLEELQHRLCLGLGLLGSFFTSLGRRCLLLVPGLRWRTARIAR